MDFSDPIVRPVCNARTPVLGPWAIIVASQQDLRLLRDRYTLRDSKQLYMSQLFYNAGDRHQPALLGPVMGAPYAAMMLETLRAWGVERVVFYGWCGSIDPALRIGDIVLPSGALIDEGTSLHYKQDLGAIAIPDKSLCRQLEDCLVKKEISFKSSLIWTTDAIFRETPGKIEHFKKQGAQAVEMELSALYAVAAFYSMPLAGMLLVSDELFSWQWQPGFRDKRFLSSREQLAGFLVDVTQTA
jgi:purine-nucleoside phosphorylase